MIGNNTNIRFIWILLLLCSLSFLYGFSMKFEEKNINVTLGEMVLTSTTSQEKGDKGEREEGEETNSDVKFMQCDVDDLPDELYNILRNQPDYIEITSENEKYAEARGLYQRFPYYQKDNLVKDPFDDSNWRFIIHKDVINGQWQLSGLNDGGSNYPMLWSKNIINFPITEEEEKEALLNAREKIMDSRISNLEQALESKIDENEMIESKLNKMEYLQQIIDTLTEENEIFQEEEEKVKEKIFKQKQENIKAQEFSDKLMLEISKQNSEIEKLTQKILKIENLRTQQNKTHELKMSMMNDIQTQKKQELEEQHQKDMKNMKMKFQKMEEKKEHEILEFEILKMKQSNQKLEENIKTLNTEQNKLEEKIDDLKLEGKTLQKNVIDVKKSKNDLEKQFNEAEKEKKLLQNVVKSIEKSGKNIKVLDFENLMKQTKMKESDQTRMLPEYLFEKLIQLIDEKAEELKMHIKLTWSMPIENFKHDEFTEETKTRAKMIIDGKADMQNPEFTYEKFIITAGAVLHFKTLEYQWNTYENKHFGNVFSQSSKYIKYWEDKFEHVDKILKDLCKRERTCFETWRQHITDKEQIKSLEYFESPTERNTNDMSKYDYLIALYGSLKHAQEQQMVVKKYVDSFKKKQK